ncbi:TIGR04561 family membrane protein [[Acholeplasma] multilocale]|uniref:TIGR04561 family membrane protein n=1 Tax=[Acholeplasma] multilocale TaxID=264638 RepID=UPI0004296E2C|nr:TIGR04561 family membrane protein [[Acholeplasma] multilocale]
MIPNAGINIFQQDISFDVIFYTFVALAAFALLIYILNMIFRKNKYRKVEKTNNVELIKITTNEKQKNLIDDEIKSIIKDRKIQVLATEGE